MNNCIKIGILGLIIGLLFTVMPDENNYTIESTFPEISSSQTCVISQAQSQKEAGRVHIARTKALCDNADLSFSKDNKLRHLFTTLLKIKLRCPEKKSVQYINLKTFPVPSHPVAYYVFGLRKIVI